jgi:hypothetical protein
MELVLGTLDFSSVGGTQTYILTVSEELQRLGHGTVIFTEGDGEMAQLARDRGVEVTTKVPALPRSADGVLARDAAVAAVLAGRYPSAPLVFVAPSEVYDFQLPPQVAGAVSRVVVMDDRVGDRIRALSLELPVVRLRQPVDVDRLRPWVPIRERPRRALLLGNYLRGSRRDLIERVCGELSIETVQVGAHGGTLLEPVAAINEADIVVGKARALLDGMACGRAAYAFDVAGAPGWVTPESYPELEANSFIGMDTSSAVDPDRLRADLSSYRSEMGLANRDLVLANHRAGRHCAELVKLFREGGSAAEPPPAALDQVARMARSLASAASRGWSAAFAAELAGERALAAEAEAERLAEELAGARAEAERLAEELAGARTELATLTATRRYRLAGALARPLDAVRARRNGGGDGG